MKKLPTGVEIHSGKLRIWFMFRGKRCRESLYSPPTPRNIKIAFEKRTSVCHAIRLGTFDYLAWFPHSTNHQDMVNINTLTVKGLFERWLTLKRIEVTEATLTNYHNRLKQTLAYLDPELLVSQLTQEHILDLRLALLSTCSASTVNTYMRTIKGVLSFAITNEYCSPRVISGIKDLKQSKSPPTPLSRDEFCRLIEACKNEQDKHLWALAVYTGLRHGELMALAWEDIDLNKGLIYVKRNLTLKGIFKLPKTTAGERVINLLDPAIKALIKQKPLTYMMLPENIRVQQREHGKIEIETVHFVFSPRVTATKETKSYYFHTSIHDKWTAAIRRARIAYRKPYQTRHTFACWMLSAGANPTFIAKQMGHSSAKEIYQTYGDWVSEHTQNQLDVLNKKYGENAPNMPLQTNKLM
ncbi:DUF3596 domain-containing protein [Photobacterium frigidiphilum]|uniref:Arm DNA-binding domain-containing protein n=1 Tax=Photobacterium frigidiphilum TaxID=264736 RepID=UPI003D09F66E